jgi:hypothetical protein
VVRTLRRVEPTAPHQQGVDLPAIPPHRFLQDPTAADLHKRVHLVGPPPSSPRPPEAESRRRILGDRIDVLEVLHADHLDIPGQFVEQEAGARIVRTQEDAEHENSPLAAVSQAMTGSTGSTRRGAVEEEGGGPRHGSLVLKGDR